MTRAEREAFLAETRVAVVSIAEPGRGPLAIPVWYDYRPGGPLRFVTGGSSRKARLLRAAGRATLCVQDESPPYRYLTVEGAVTIGAPEYERDIRAVALRYLGAEMGQTYLEATSDQNAGAILVTLATEHWLSVDYRKWGA
jgi:hypothetical protein